MGSGCNTVIELRTNDDSPWVLWDETPAEEAQFLREEFGKDTVDFEPVYLVRGWDLYLMLGALDDDRLVVPRRNAPTDLSVKLSDYLYRVADYDARDRMNWITLKELEQVSDHWDAYLRSCGEDPEDAEVSLRNRVKACRRAGENGAAVRFIYWFSS